MIREWNLPHGKAEPPEREGAKYISLLSKTVSSLGKGRRDLCITRLHKGGETSADHLSWGNLDTLLKAFRYGRLRCRLRTPRSWTVFVFCWFSREMDHWFSARPADQYCRSLIALYEQDLDEGLFDDRNDIPCEEVVGAHACSYEGPA